MKLNFCPRHLRLCWPLIALGLAMARPANSQIMPGFTVAADDPAPLATALAGFVESGNTWKPLAEGLLAKGAKIDGANREGQTPLIRVLVSGATSQQEKVEWLLSHGADVQICANDGQNALEAALSTPQQVSNEIIALLLAKTDVKIRDGNGATPLFAAVTRGDARFVQQILDKGADINAQNFAGDTALHLAARAPGPILQMLLKAGARTDFKNRRGDLPLHIALRRRDRYLATGQTLFQNLEHEIAERNSNENMMPRGTPIAPLTNKSDINARDQFGLSSLLLAILARDQESCDLILAKKPKIDATTQLFVAASEGNLVALKTLLTQKPFLVYFRLPDGTTPLHVSALWGTLGAAQLLVQHGAAINALDSRSETPLQETLTRPVGIFAQRAKKMMAWLLNTAQMPMPSTKTMPRLCISPCEAATPIWWPCCSPKMSI